MIDDILSFASVHTFSVVVLLVPTDPLRTFSLAAKLVRQGAEFFNDKVWNGSERGNVFFSFFFVVSCVAVTLKSTVDSYGCCLLKPYYSRARFALQLYS